RFDRCAAGLLQSQPCYEDRGRQSSFHRHSSTAERSHSYGLLLRIGDPGRFASGSCRIGGIIFRGRHRAPRAEAGMTLVAKISDIQWTGIFTLFGVAIGTYLSVLLTNSVANRDEALQAILALQAAFDGHGPAKHRGAGTRLNPQGSRLD